MSFPQIIVEDVVDHAPILWFISPDADRTNPAYPTRFNFIKLIDYNTNESVNFLSDIYLRDDRQIQSITVSFQRYVANVSDELLWNQTLVTSLRIDNTTEESSTLTTYTFSANLNETDWEMFLMTFSFLCNDTRAADRMLGSRTIIISANDGNNTSTVMVDINVLPLPPVINIDVPNINFTEGDSYALLRDLEDPISVIQDMDSRFTSLNVTLRYILHFLCVFLIMFYISSILQSGYSLGPTEMINDFIPPVSIKTMNTIFKHVFFREL